MFGTPLSFPIWSTTNATSDESAVVHDVKDITNANTKTPNTFFILLFKFCE